MWSLLEWILFLPGAILTFPVLSFAESHALPWLNDLGWVIGGALFWFCVGSEIETGLAERRQPLRVRAYMKTLRLLSLLALPFALLAGLRLGQHYCAVGAPEGWVEIVSYGIVMFWIALGCYSFFMRRAEKRRGLPVSITRDRT